MSFVAKEAYDDLQCRYIQVADMLRRIVADYRRSDEDVRGVSAMESLIEEAERLVDGDTAAPGAATRSRRSARRFCSLLDCIRFSVLSCASRSERNLAHHPKNNL